MIYEILVKEGYARVDTVPPDVKYSNIFLTAENESRTNNLGLWKKCQ
jgi:micrococcal nuclease